MPNKYEYYLLDYLLNNLRIQGVYICNQILFTSTIFFFLCVCVSMQPIADARLQDIFDKIRIAVYKNRVRTIEFFKDYDKLRSGYVTENQFMCGLSLAVGKEAQLLRPEIQKVAEFYKRGDGCVNYREFCDMMENGEQSNLMIILQFFFGMI